MVLANSRNIKLAKPENALKTLYFHSAPDSILSSFAGDKGKVLKKLLATYLRLAALQHARTDPQGKWLIQPGPGLLGGWGPSPTDRHLHELEPWELAVGTLCSDNLGLFLAIWHKDPDSFPELRGRIPDSVLISAAIVMFSSSVVAPGASVLSAYNQLCFALRREHSDSQIKALDESISLAKLVQDAQRKLKRFGRQKSGDYARLLELTRAARAKNSKLTRSNAAIKFAADHEIGLKRTQILRYYEETFSEDEWPKHPGGRPPKTVRKS